MPQRGEDVWMNGYVKVMFKDCNVYNFGNCYWYLLIAKTLLDIHSEQLSAFIYLCRNEKVSMNLSSLAL